jgi:hypothetical protein
MSSDDTVSQAHPSLTEGFKQLVSEAKSEVQLYTPSDVTDRVGDDDALFVDVRETAELVKNGQIPGAVHAPRGMLEPHIDPGSPYFMEQFGDEKEFVFYCAVGAVRRSLHRPPKRCGSAGWPPSTAGSPRGRKPAAVSRSRGRR